MDSPSLQSIDGLFTKSFKLLGARPSAGALMAMECTFTLALNAIDISSCSSASDSTIINSWSRRPCLSRDPTASVLVAFNTSQPLQWMDSSRSSIAAAP